MDNYLKNGKRYYDTEVMYEARQESLAIMECLHLYGQASGQTVNFDKSSIMFSRNTSLLDKSTSCSILGVKEQLGERTTYLGLPCLIGRKKKGIFSFIKDRVWKRLQGWTYRYLSKSGKEILIKTVLLSQIILWGNGRDGGGIHLKNWDKLCVPRFMGGWRLATNPDSIVSRLLKAHYFPISSFFSARLSGNPSFVWISSLVKFRSSWVIGDGQTVSISGEPWLMNIDNPFTTTDLHPTIAQASVNSLLKVDAKEWDLDVVSDLFNSRDISEIVSIPLVPDKREDSLSWRLERRGIYSVRSGYKHLMQTRHRGSNLDVRSGWKDLWHLHIPPKVKNFLWRVISGWLPTRDALRSRHVELEAICRVYACQLTTLGQWMQLFISQMVDQQEQNAMVLWGIWENQNNLVWHGRGNSATYSLPQVGHVTCNLDVAIFRDNHRIGIACVVRDHDGKCLGARARSMPGLQEPLMAEAISFKESLTWVKGLASHNVRFETDALLLVQVFYSSLEDRSSVGLIVKECKHLLRDYVNSSLSYVRISANMIAHTLTRASISMSDISIWWSDIPEFLSFYLYSDISN
ncbi:uncharacterized protein LOC126687501 [Mercurialis annua]|uniref:uncharacterized protein LOC126687501 n=1 Tax=Mercurialis annua TaxID=3986 RepID=UPI002160E863|nr:uncharacterized protein LOC126687501 [Mercurialis annua]